MTKALISLSKGTLSPEVLKELKLDKEWSSKVPESYVSQVIRLAEQNKDTLKELADH